jgi:hypothetical protein
MTDVRTNHPNNLPYIELTEEGRHISFRKECLGAIKIYRKVNENDWNMLIKDTKTPFVDMEDFPEGTHLVYAIELEQNSENHRYELEARL